MKLTSCARAARALLCVFAAVQTGTRFLSREGRTLTFTQKGVNANGQQINDFVVFDKQ